MDDLKKVWLSEEWGNCFEEEISWKLGDDKDIRFWEDKWLDNEVLRVKFPRLFSIANEKSASL